MLNVFVGYDDREAVAFHTFNNSLIRHASSPISITAINDKLCNINRDNGSNSFTYSRYLIPELMNYQGWAVFADGDMISTADIYDLMQYADYSKAVMVVKHDYKTKYPRKYLGATNEDYPRKNWSSLVLWNCGHQANKVLTRQYVESATPKHLHRFEWLYDSLIGELRPSWNWLAMEYSNNCNPKIVHYTVGTPCFPEYADCDFSDLWHNEYNLTITPCVNNP